MDIDYTYFTTQRTRNAAWNLLRANRAPVILAFVHEAFIKQGRTSAPESELIEILKDLIFKINGGKITFDDDPLDDDDFYPDSDDGDDSEGEELDGMSENAIDDDRPKKRRRRKGDADSDSIEMRDDPIHYLRYWSSEKSRYFRCSYLGASGTEPVYDITPELQRAYSFIAGMNDVGTNFVPTESRFRELLEILKEVHMSTEGNAQLYLDDLLAKRAAIDAEIERAKRGEINTLSPSQIRERFLQFQHDAIELVDDFRQVEYNLGDLDKEIMQDILNWTGPRGELLDKYFNQNAYIENTDQGRSVKTFSRLLLSSSDDEAIIKRIDNLLNRPELEGLKKDERILNIHDQWLSLRLNIERVMGASTKRIKSFLQPANLDSNRFLKERIKSITEKVAALTKEQGVTNLPKSLFTLEIPRAEINLPFDRPLATVSDRLEFETDIKNDDFQPDDHKLFDQVVVDPVALYEHIEEFMSEKNEVNLHDIVKKYPLEHGITELTTYVKLAMMDYQVVEDPNTTDLYRWEAIDPEGNRVARVAKLNHITLKRIQCTNRSKYVLI